MGTVTQHAEDVVALNADVVGYSRLLAEDPERVAGVMDEYRHLVSAEVTSRGGTVVNFVGDNFMAVFPAAEAAIAAAIGIAKEVENRNQEVSSAQRIRFRMGLDQGSVTVTAGDYFGDVLNIAARIQAIALPGGISVSGQVYRALDEPALRFRSAGSHRLKNIPEGIEVYEMSDLPSDSSGSLSRSSLSLESPTVAVLPILNEHADEALTGAGDLIRSDMIHRLTQIPGLRVVETGTDPEGRLEEIARYLVETGLHQFGEQARIYATIFDVTTWNIVKSHKWTADVDNLLSISEEMADDVARSIEVELIVGEPAGLYADLEDPDTIEKVYLGWYHLRKDTEEGWTRAVELFEQVAEAKPDQPYGHVLAAFANWAGAANRFGPDPNTTMERAFRQARRGEEVGDPTGMATAVVAAVLMSQGKEQEALRTMENLQIIRPTCDVTYGLEGSVRRYIGQWERSVDLLDIAMRLTGLNKPWYPTVQACSYFVGGRMEQAASVAEGVLEHHPKNLEALAVLAAAQMELGMERSAHATAERIKQHFPSTDVGAWLEAKPYQDKDLVKRWKRDLELAGAL